MNGVKIFFVSFTIGIFLALMAGYSLIMTSAPVAIAQAQAQVITARSDADIREWYAQAALADRTAARERANSDAPWLVAIASIILAGLVIIAVIIGGAISFAHNRQRDYLPAQRTMVIDGERYRVIGQSGEWVQLEQVSQYELAERRN